MNKPMRLVNKPISKEDMTIYKEENSKGDRVVIRFNSKFLKYTSW